MDMFIQITIITNLFVLSSLFVLSLMNLAGFHYKNDEKLMRFSKVIWIITAVGSVLGLITCGCFYLEII